jgi:hypothetical protein
LIGVMEEIPRRLFYLLDEKARDQAIKGQAINDRPGRAPRRHRSAAASDRAFLLADAERLEDFDHA